MVGDGLQEIRSGLKPRDKVVSKPPVLQSTVKQKMIQGLVNFALDNSVWTENSTLAIRRPIPGGVESAEPVNTSLVGPGQALESTMRPVHFESVRKIGRARLLSVCVYLSARAGELVLRTRR